MRQLFRIRDTGLNTPTDATNTRARVNDGAWVSLYADRVTYDHSARIGEASQRQLSGGLTSPYRYDDVTHAGVNNPTIMVSGAVDTDLEGDKEHLKILFAMLTTQGVKEIEGDFLSFVDVNPVLVRIRNITLNPPNYGSGVNKVRYQMNMVRVA